MEYANKIITINQLLDIIKCNDQIVTGLGVSEPQVFLSNLHLLANKVNNVTINLCHPMQDYEFISNPSCINTFNIASWFYSSTLRKYHNNGNISYIPATLGNAGLKRFSNIKPRIFICCGTYPDENGMITLPFSNVYENEAIQASDIVIIECNKKAPKTFTDAMVHIDKVDHILEVDYDFCEIQDQPLNEKDVIIGKYIAKYINDGDCIQLGIGNIPNAVAKFLYDKKDLGIHSEMLTNEMVNLAKKGIITGKYKQINNGKIVASFAMGNKNMYDFLNNNEDVVILSGAYVNDPNIIAKNDNQVSINTTIEVDITGQCCSESIGSFQYSGTGGQSNTVIGSQLSKNGKSFIALYSTALIKDKKTNKVKEVSKIVCQLKKGAAVSLSRNDLDYLVTEYGCVSLKGLSIKERAEKIISIAHPKFRAKLIRQAKKLNIL